MSNEFKVGDIVKCTNNIRATHYLTLDKEYKVVEVLPISNSIRVKDDTLSENGYYTSRFQKVEQFKVGDSLECIEECEGQLTLGKIYTCEFVYPHEVQVTDDLNEPKVWRKKRFKKVEKMEKVQVDTVNKNINKEILDIAEKNGYKLDYGIRNHFWRYLVIRSDNSIGGNNSNAGHPFISINEFVQRVVVKPIMIGKDQVLKVENGIKVGCTTITMEQIEAIYKLAKGE